MKSFKRLTQLNNLLLYEVIALIGSTIYLILKWNEQVTVATNAVSLFWVELVYLLYMNLKEREE